MCSLRSAAPESVWKPTSAVAPSPAKATQRVRFPARRSWRETPPARQGPFLLAPHTPTPPPQRGGAARTGASPGGEGIGLADPAPELRGLDPRERARGAGRDTGGVPPAGVALRRPACGDVVRDAAPDTGDR